MSCLCRSMKSASDLPSSSDALSLFGGSSFSSNIILDQKSCLCSRVAIRGDKDKFCRSRMALMILGFRRLSLPICARVP